MSMPHNRRRRPHRDRNENPQHQRAVPTAVPVMAAIIHGTTTLAAMSIVGACCTAGVIIPMMPLALIDSANIVAAMITEMTCA